MLKSTKEGSTAVKKVSVEEQAKQFKEDLYVDGGILFCKYCQHSVDYVRVDTTKDHLLSKKHLSRKEKDDSCSSNLDLPGLDFVNTAYQASFISRVLCLAHIVNLSAEVFQHCSEFHFTADLITMIKSSMFKTPGRK